MSPANQTTAQYYNTSLEYHDINREYMPKIRSQIEEKMKMKYI